jgi:hypothetical protein
MPYALREALAAFRRTPLLAMLSIVAVSLSLFVVGLFAPPTFTTTPRLSRYRPPRPRSSGWRWSARFATSPRTRR